MDIGPTDVQIKNPLQHNGAKLNGLDKKLNLIQKQKIQHGSVARHNA